MTTTHGNGQLPTQSLLRDLYAMAEFVTAHAAVLPDAPWAADVSFKAESIGHLREIAEHFGSEPYGEGWPERRGQVCVMIPGTAGFVRLFVSWEAA
jgi:hypothetical protein